MGSSLASASLVIGRGRLRLDGYLDVAGIIAEHLDYRFRTDDGAGGTARTISVVCLGGKVAVSVGFFGDDDAVFRANFNA